MILDEVVWGLGEAFDSLILRLRCLVEVVEFGCEREEEEVRPKFLRWSNISFAYWVALQGYVFRTAGRDLLISVETSLRSAVLSPPKGACALAMASQMDPADCPFAGT